MLKGTREKSHFVHDSTVCIWAFEVYLNWKSTKLFHLSPLGLKISHSVRDLDFQGKSRSPLQFRVIYKLPLENRCIYIWTNNSSETTGIHKLGVILGEKSVSLFFLNPCWIDLENNFMFGLHVIFRDIPQLTIQLIFQLQPH